MSGRTSPRFNSICPRDDGRAAPGYSSAKDEEVMKTAGRNGYEWSGLTLQEKKSEGQAPIIFGMAVLFVFLC
jgi:multidrug efflux pump subunit AcrB